MASRRSAQKFIALVGVMVAVGSAQARTTRYVDDDAPGDPCPGDPTCSDPLENGSVAYPFDAMQECINASVDGDTCIVGDGTYTGPGNRDLSFAGRLITLRALNGPGTCTMDCQGLSRGLSFVNGESGQAVVEGLMFHHGSANNGAGIVISNGSSPTIINCHFMGNTATIGGGMSITANSNPTIANCLFSENEVTGTASSVSGRGGGIYCHNSNPTIIGCTFTQNTATGGTAGSTGTGGGLYSENSNASMTLANCVFSGNRAIGTVVNTALGGGAIFFASSPTVTNCTFSGNTATGPFNAFIGYGGGMTIAFNSNPTLTGCTFVNNHASYGSGAMWIFDSPNPKVIDATFVGNTAAANSGALNVLQNSNLTITGCTFKENATDGFGGAMIVARNSSAEVSNCLFIGNTAATYGGAFYSSATFVGAPTGSFADPTLTNCTFAGNTAGISGGGIYSTDEFGGHATTTLRNSIVWGNLPDQVLDVFGAVTTVTYSDVQGPWTGAGGNNIDLDPLFVDPDGPDNDPATFADNDYHLHLNSPTIDAADSAAVPADEFDLDNDGDTAEPIPVDLDGDPRFLDIESMTDTGTGKSSIVDMGPFEAPEALARAIGSRFLAVVPGIHDLGYVAIRVTSNDFPCIDKYVTLNGSLSNTLVFQNSDAWSTVYVHGEEIRPGSSYQVRVEGATSSPAFEVATWRFGDVNNNGAANFEDLLLMAIEFQEGTYSYAADIAECIPDGVVNVVDILQGVLAFQGGTHLDLCGAGCP